MRRFPFYRINISSYHLTSQVAENNEIMHETDFKTNAGVELG